MKRSTSYRPLGWPVGTRQIDRYPLGRYYLGPSYDWRRDLPRGLTTNQCLAFAITVWAAGVIVIWGAYLFL